MRIISKFKDYYDSAAGYGVDTTVVYQRSTKTLPNQSLKAEEQHEVTQQREIVAACTAMVHPDHFKNLTRNSDPHNGLIFVGLAGKIYVGLQFNVSPNDPKKELFRQFRYDDHVETLIAWQPSNLTAEQLAAKRKSFWWMDNKAETPADWFNNKRVVENIELFAKYNMVSFVAYSPRGNNGITVTVDPCLLDYGFQRLIDGYTVFQEVSMFVTGVLAQKDQMTYVPSDKELLYARGHDDMSFKKAPTKNR